MLIILTRAALKDFICPTFEIGCFYGMMLQDEKEKRRIVCIYPDGESMPDPLRNIQGVPANQKAVEDLLRQLYTEEAFTFTNRPINRSIREESIKFIAKSICTGINRGDGNEVKYCRCMNPHIRVMLDEGMVKRIKKPGPEGSLKDIFAGAQISSDFKNDDETNNNKLQEIFRCNHENMGMLVRSQCSEKRPS